MKLESAIARLSNLHGDQRGSISISSMFGLLILVMLLGMVMNSVRQVDQKVKMQNAADAASYSGGVVIARSLNSMAFSNHLLGEIFSLTAFMREGRDQVAVSLTPEILANWQRTGPAFTGSEYPPFDMLGQAITQKTPLETEMLRAYSEWTAAASELMLPVLEQILAEQQIPEFQRALTLSAPRMAQIAADETAQRHGNAWPREVEVRGVLWRTDADPVGGANESTRSTLPVVDPELYEGAGQADYFDAAVEQRREDAERYLNHWNSDSLRAFDLLGKMSQFGSLWRIITAGQLKKLLEVDYPDSNLPFQIRHEFTRSEADESDVSAELERDYMFVAVVYATPLREHSPGVFRNPLGATSQAYSQVFVFTPRTRLIKVFEDNTTTASGAENFGGVPGQTLELPAPPRNNPVETPDPEAATNEYEDFYVTRQSSSWYPSGWNLKNQNWTIQPAPATSASIPAILSTQPYVDESMSHIRTPDLSGMDARDLQWVSHH